MSNKEKILLEVKGLKKYFKSRKKQILNAVDDVCFYINEGETLGIVGESGCGKTTLGRTCIGIYDKTDGQVLYKGKDVHDLNKKDKKLFTKDVQIIFQDPYASLNPKMKVGNIISEGIKAHKILTNKEDIDKKVKELLISVGLHEEHSTRYIHEFSGGQRQRVGIARALAVEPKLIVCDEPISALDVSIQAQIVNLLMKLQKEKNLTYIFIAHDLSMVKYISDRVAVMYLGKIVEITTSDNLYKNPKHPYTKALLSSIPIPDPKIEENKKRIKLEGELPSPINKKAGCKFQNRCKYSKKICSIEEPLLKEKESNHFVACHMF